MASAALQLKPIGDAGNPTSPEIHFLTGNGHWFMTVFCAHSLLRHTREPLRFVIHDDGAMNADTRSKLEHLLPSATIASREEVEERLDRELPVSRFPSLRERRLHFPLLRKLMDVHAGKTGQRLFLDSDMLFFREPTAMLDWFRTSTAPCYMADFQYAYGYDNALMEALVGGPVPQRVNTGICGLQSETLDWDRIEHWNRVLQAAEGGYHLQEQALTAMAMAGGPHSPLPPRDYLIMPTRNEVLRPTAVMHHYVWQARSLYYRYAWRHLMSDEFEPVESHSG
jgi:hypothetical protein